MALWSAGGGSTFWVGIYLAGAAIVTLVALALTHDTRDVEYIENLE